MVRLVQLLGTTERAVATLCNVRHSCNELIEHYLRTHALRCPQGFDAWAIGYTVAMDIFRNYTFTWWQVGLLKLALFSLGIAIGSYCQATFLPYATVLAILGLGLGAYIGWISFRHR